MLARGRSEDRVVSDETGKTPSINFLKGGKDGLESQYDEMKKVKTSYC